MKTFFYGENTIDLFKLLKRQMPNSIFSDGIQVIFDYVDCHIISTPEVYAAASQNKSDEVINAEFQHIDLEYKPYEYDKLIFQNKAIDRLWILRTMLYFTDHVIFNSETEALGNFEIKTEIDRALANIMRQSTGGHSEVVCHPQSLEAEGVNKEFANLVDAGIMLKIDNKLLMCFSFHNGFGIVGSVMSPHQTKEDILPFYELIEIV